MKQKPDFCLYLYWYSQITFKVQMLTHGLQSLTVWEFCYLSDHHCQPASAHGAFISSSLLSVSWIQRLSQSPVITKANPTPVTCSMTPLPHFPHNILCIPMVSDLVFILFFIFSPNDNRDVRYFPSYASLHNELWKALKETIIPGHLTFLLRNLYAGEEATVRTLYGTIGWFKIEKGVWKPCLVLPCLFNL